MKPTRDLSKQPSQVYGRQFLQDLLSQRPQLSPSLAAATSEWLTNLRHQAGARLAELAIPTPQEEEWKYTDLSDLVKQAFQIPQQLPPLPTELQAHLTWPEAARSRLVFVNGFYAPHLSDTQDLPADLWVGTLTEMPLERVHPYIQGIVAEDVFTTLNTACLTDAAVVLLPKGMQLPQPIHLLFLTLPQDRPVLAQPRCLLVAASNSSVSLIEDYAGLGEGIYGSNAVTELWLHPNAQIRHLKLQREGSAAFHLAKTAVLQERDSRYTGHAISLGAQLSRHTWEVIQAGEQSSTQLQGLAMIGADQLADTHSLIHHRLPFGSSRQLHKCIVQDHAHAVFNGKVLVEQTAQLTDAGQSNANLLLSPKARVDTKPQLEIFADNVKCSHGATVSQLEADEVFYLQSRGIDPEQARQWLTYAFAAEVIEQVGIQSIQSYCEQQVLQQTGMQL
jgi:Fe-S cluster assembly protein SufD